MTRFVVVVLLAAACSKTSDCPSERECFEFKKRFEAGGNLDAIGAASKRVFKDTGSFVVGTAAQLPAYTATIAAGCCGGVGGTKAEPGKRMDNKCTIDPAAFAADPVWKKLDFSIDKPTYYQYSYVGDAKSFTATAIGDVDCDGQAATFMLAGSVDASGEVHLVATRPPAGVY